MAFHKADMWLQWLLHCLVSRRMSVQNQSGHLGTWRGLLATKIQIKCDINTYSMDGIIYELCYMLLYTYVDTFGVLIFLLDEAAVERK